MRATLPARRARNAEPRFSCLTKKAAFPPDGGLFLYCWLAFSDARGA